MEESQVRITLKGELNRSSIDQVLYRKRYKRKWTCRELSRLQDKGILRRVEISQWAAPIVVVRKADGTVCLCGDFKVTVTPYLEINPYPMHNPEDLFATIARGAIFSRLDMKHAYQQLQVKLDSQEYLTVNTSKGLAVRLHSMPFGISTAPASGRENG